MDRARLVDRLLREGGTPVVAAVAPAGYGKTTLLTQWLRRDTRPSAWVTIHREDNDPAILLANLAHAFRATGQVNENDLADMRLPSSDAPTLGVARLAAALVGASAYVAIADVSGARGVMRDLVAISPPHLGTLTTRRALLEASLAAMPTGNVGVSTLTTAELRLLPLLATHLSFPEIGERLFVSRHTVKTQAMSIYRKLEVSSRSEAVTRLRELGLLGS